MTSRRGGAHDGGENRDGSVDGGSRGSGSDARLRRECGDVAVIVELQEGVARRYLVKCRSVVLVVAVHASNGAGPEGGVDGAKLIDFTNLLGFVDGKVWRGRG